MAAVCRQILPLLALCAASLALFGAEPPNVLIIVADDMGYSDLGCYGGEIQTPNIDRLAQNGLRFTQFYNTSRCWPTRAAILSGYYPQQVRMDPPQGPLPAWAKLLPHHLKAQGYRSYHSGKWHVQGAPRAVADGGFDRSYKLDDHDRFFDPRNHMEDDRRLPAVDPASGYYATTAIADHAIRSLKDHAQVHAGKPFFEYLAFTSPHFPLHAMKEDIDRYVGKYDEGWDMIRRRRWERMREMRLIDSALPERDAKTIPPWNLAEAELKQQIGAGEAGYAAAWTELSDEQRKLQAMKMAIHAAMVDRMDREIGRVIEQIRSMGALDNTVIFLCSDNGATAEQIIRGDRHDPAKAPGSAGTYLSLGPGWSTASNTPFRLHKHWVHEGGISTPLIVHWPRGIEARGAFRHDAGHVIDFVPTVLELTGASRLADLPELPGRSLVPAFSRDGAIQRDFLFFHHQGNRALRIGDWKLVSAKTGGDAWELYDLKNDRAEAKNLVAEQAGRARDMERRWRELDAQFVGQAGPPPARLNANPAR